MENLIFSLQATIPVFLLMVIGYIFKRIKLFDAAFVARMNRFVFLVALPLLLFRDLATEDFSAVWDGTYVLFCGIVTLCSIALASACSLVIANKAERGEFVQVAYRSSAAVLGIAFITNIYGNSGMAPLMIIGTVPLYNIFAVVVLMVTAQDPSGSKTLTKTIKGIFTNPILLGVAGGFLWSVLHLPYPVILEKTVNNLAGLATPLGLMAMGGSFSFESISEVWKPAVAATFMKLVGWVVLFLPLAVHLGFRDSKLVAVLVMLGSASTVSCFVMAINMHHKGDLTAATVMLTTLCSAFTLTFWLFLLKSMSWI